MRTPVVNRAEPPVRRRALDGVLVFGGAILLLFALVGIVSAAKFVGDKMGGSSSKSTAPVKHTRPVGTSVALQDIARAQTQATAIVKAAQSAGSTIIKDQTSRARRQANSIVSTAKKQAASTAASNASAAPSSAPSGTGTGTGSTSSSVGGSSTASSGVTVSTPTGPCNTRGMPRSWQLIVCGASLGHGPGNAGGVSLYNRGSHPFSGVVRVDYLSARGARVGSATGAFSSVPGGRVALVPLNGQAYPRTAATWRVRLVSLSP